MVILLVSAGGKVRATSGALIDLQTTQLSRCGAAPMLMPGAFSSLADCCSGRWSQSFNDWRGCRTGRSTEVANFRFLHMNPIEMNHPRCKQGILKTPYGRGAAVNLIYIVITVD